MTEIETFGRAALVARYRTTPACTEKATVGMLVEDARKKGEQTYLARHFLGRVKGNLADGRNEVHFDECHGACETLLEPNDVDLGVSEVSLKPIGRASGCW